ncbi:MAG: translation initiation factor IF-2 [Ignavibacteria bacterium]|nr:translation initiation factor IF-2 [Ignavibacteria bacterium]
MAVSGTKLFKVATQINIGRDAIVEYLVSKGFTVQNKPTAVLTDEMVDVVVEKFAKELKVAEKQREKVQRHQQVRKTLMEHGTTISIDTIAEAQQREEELVHHLEHHDDVVAAKPPTQPVEDETIEVDEPVVEQQEEAEVEVEEPQDVAEPVEEVQAQSDVETTEVEEAQETTEAQETDEVQPDVEEAEQTGTATKKKTGPQVGQVIDLKKVPKPPPPPHRPKEDPKKKEELLKKEQDKVEQAKKDQAKHVAKQQEQQKAKVEETAQADSEEKKKRKRKGVVEVELQGGTRTTLRGLTVIGKIDLATRPVRGKKPKPGKATIGDAFAGGPKKKTDSKPASTTGGSANAGPTRPNFGAPARPGGNKVDDRKKKRTGKGARDTFSESDVERAIRATLAGMEDTGLSGRNKVKQRKKIEREVKAQMRQDEIARESTMLRLSEFVTTADLANLMRVTPADIIMKCMGLGLMVSINQRLDKETIILIASDYGFEVEFLDGNEEQEIVEVEDDPESLQTRSPIVTIMGHVDHGKTSLLDYIRNANVVSGEAGGITQHIGAYRVEVPNGRHIAFLDTPGHEAFTAMRARGAQVTDIVVLVVSADDSVMPQTIEAISHAQAANVPIVVAINKMDRAEANPDRIKQQLADRGVLVEDWGGKNQSAEISAKTGANIDQLLEKILLEADVLDLKANPDRQARGTVIEAHVDKGRGNVVTVMVQKGTLSVGGIFVCGQFAGRVRAMTDERGNRIENAGPSTPAQVTGFDGLPNAGDILIEMESEAEAREIGNRRQQLRREQQFRGMRHMTLDDISVQIQQGGVKELRLIVKADVGGSSEALADSLLKLSTPEVQVRILHKSVGAITESDIMLAAASDAIIVGFQVNISPQARKIAEAETVDVRLYSIIYDCINEVQLALEGLLTPDIKEEITGTVEVRAVFKISKLGTIAGCYVQNGRIIRNDRVRVLRDGFEIYKGTLDSLKRIKDDVREVETGFECGMAVHGFNDIQEGDIIEAYKTIEVKRKLS